MMDIDAYCREIEAHLCRRNAGHLVRISGPAFDLVRGWAQQGIPFKVIVDGASGHFLRKGGVDFCVVGTDRVAANGDVANKIGTYLKALAAKDNGIPFYVALPGSTSDWNMLDGIVESSATRQYHRLTSSFTAPERLTGDEEF